MDVSFFKVSRVPICLFLPLSQTSFPVEFSVKKGKPKSILGTPKAYFETSFELPGGPLGP